MKEVIEYFLHRNGPVYACMLDCSKAFDRLEYVRMFDVLIERAVCPNVIRLLLFMYSHQRACVKWRNTTSEFFTVRNGVKQGGVISPVLFTLYIDTLLNRLEEKGVGCWVAGQYCGAFAYADDVILLAPSRSALVSMLHTCSEFSNEFDVIFNAAKTKLLLYGVRDIAPVPFMQSTIEVVPHDKHLGVPIGQSHNKLLVDVLCKEMMSKANMLYVNFRYLHIDSLYHLFKTYCTPLYGCQLVDFSSREAERIFVTWRKAIRFLLQLPFTTHCALLPHICNDISIQTQLHSRTIKFFSSCMSSENRIVRLCAEIAQYSRSHFGRSLSCLSRLYNCQKSELPWADLHTGNETDDHLIVDAALIRDLLESRRDSNFNATLLTPAEIEFALNVICTE